MAGDDGCDGTSVPKPGFQDWNGMADCVKAPWQDPEPQTKGLSRMSQGYGETELSPEKQLKAETKEN